MTLFEALMKQFGISSITKKAIDKKGLGDVTFINATVHEHTMQLLFEVQSSNEEGAHHVDLKGHASNLKHGYSVVVEFIGITSYAKDGKITNKEMHDIVDKCDCKVHCDCPAFYWQGMHQSDDEKANAKFRFAGTKGKDIWIHRHMVAGSNQHLTICKHIHAALEYLEGHLDTMMSGQTFYVKSDEAKKPEDSTDDKASADDNTKDAKDNSKDNEEKASKEAPAKDTKEKPEEDEDSKSKNIVDEHALMKALRRIR